MGVIGVCAHPGDSNAYKYDLQQIPLSSVTGSKHPAASSQLFPNAMAVAMETVPEGDRWAVERELRLF